MKSQTSFSVESLLSTRCTINPRHWKKAVSVRWHAWYTSRLGCYNVLVAEYAIGFDPIKLILLSESNGSLPARKWGGKKLGCFRIDTAHQSDKRMTKTCFLYHASCALVSYSSLRCQLVECYISMHSTVPTYLLSPLISSTSPKRSEKWHISKRRGQLLEMISILVRNSSGMFTSWHDSH